MRQFSIVAALAIMVGISCGQKLPADPAVSDWRLIPVSHAEPLNTGFDFEVEQGTLHLAYGAGSAIYYTRGEMITRRWGQPIQVTAGTGPRIFKLDAALHILCTDGFQLLDFMTQDGESRGTKRQL